MANNSSNSVSDPQSTASNNSIVEGDSSEDGYEILHTTFEGNPDIVAIKRLIEPVMIKYDMKLNYLNLNKVGSCLISLKQKSAIGITEMDILKVMYQNSPPSKKFPEQATLAWYYLEKTQIKQLV